MAVWGWSEQSRAGKESRGIGRAAQGAVTTAKLRAYFRVDNSVLAKNVFGLARHMQRSKKKMLDVDVLVLADIGLLRCASQYGLGFFIQSHVDGSRNPLSSKTPFDTRFAQSFQLAFRQLQLEEHG